MVQEGSREVDPAILRRSVVRTAPSNGSPETSGGIMDAGVLWFVADAADEITAWGRNPKMRDRQLRAFYPKEAYFTSALGVVASRNMAFSWSIEGPPRVSQLMQEVLDNANFGEGWHDLIAKTTIDLSTQDNGAFWEIVRAADSPKSPPIAINHLDSEFCWHTRDPANPVIYRDIMGGRHLLPWYSVVSFSELPAPQERIRGVQLCALTRLLRAAQVLRNVSLYEEEKTGGRFVRALHLISGIRTDEINQALEMAQRKADDKGLLRYIQPLVVGSVDPKANLDHKMLELVTLPDGWNKENEVKLYITILAMAFLTDYQEFAPLPGGNLGTSAQSEVLHMKSRGKGPGLFMKLISHALNFRVLPNVVEFTFDEQDLEAENAEADIQKKHAETDKIWVDSGVLTAEAARQRAVDRGDISQEILAMMDQPDVTPDREVSDEEKPAEQQAVTATPAVGAAAKQEVRQPARAGPFRGTADSLGEPAAPCCGESSCCYTD